MTYRIEYVYGQPTEGKSWLRREPVPGVDYTSQASCLECAAQLDADEDGAMTHRVVEVEECTIDEHDPRAGQWVAKASYRRIERVA